MIFMTFQTFDVRSLNNFEQTGFELRTPLAGTQGGGGPPPWVGTQGGGTGGYPSTQLCVPGVTPPLRSRGQGGGDQMNKLKMT